MDPKQEEARIVRIGGLGYGKTIEIFHPTNSSISHVSKDLADFIPVRGHQCHLIDKNRVLIIGGLVDANYLQHKNADLLNQTSYLNLKTFDVKPGPCLPTPIAPISTSLNGIVYLCGAKTSGRIKDATAAAAACYKLIINNHKWVATSSMNIGRFGHTMSALDGHLYAFGGDDANHKSLKSIERYDPRTDKWVELKSQMIFTRTEAASLVHRRNIWVTGGLNDDGEMMYTTEVFDPITARVSYGPLLNQKRGCHSMVEFCGKMYVIGGFGNFKTMEVFNDDAYKWEMVNHELERNCWYGDFVVSE